MVSSSAKPMAALQVNDRNCHTPFPFPGSAKGGTFKQCGSNLWCGICVSQRTATSKPSLRNDACTRFARFWTYAPHLPPHSFSSSVVRQRRMGSVVNGPVVNGPDSGLLLHVADQHYVRIRVPADDRQFAAIRRPVEIP